MSEAEGVIAASGLSPEVSAGGDGLAVGAAEAVGPLAAAKLIKKFRRTYIKLTMYKVLELT